MSSRTWARYVAGVVAELRPPVGLRGQRCRRRSRSAPGCRRAPRSRWRSRWPSVPTGRRSSIARLCQRAEQRASGVPCGIMDQLASAGGVEGHALLHRLPRRSRSRRCRSPTTSTSSWSTRASTDAARRVGYAERVRACAAAERAHRPAARRDDRGGRRDRRPDVRARARHVVSENARVRLVRRGDPWPATLATPGA